MTLIAIPAGGAGYFATRRGSHTIAGPLESALPPAQHPLLAAVWWASLGAMLALFASAITLAAWAWRKRAFYAELLRRR